MPIRINLLAEAQAAEELRRKDPAKRALWVAAFLVILVLVWSSSLQLKLMSDNATLSQLDAKWAAHTNDFQQVLTNQKKLADINEKLDALHKLATSRFLQADALNALQYTTVDGVQLTRYRCDQSFVIIPEEKPKKVDNKVIPGKPGSSTEKIVITLDAKDSSPNPGNERINSFKEKIAQQPYFRQSQISTNAILLKNLSSPQVDNDTGGSFVLFTFECRYPDRFRSP